MDDNASKENQPANELNKIDLSQLQGFSFGTQWTQDKSGQGDRRPSEDRPRRDGGGGFERRDRRGFRRPAGVDGGGDPAPAGGPRREEGGERRFRSGPGEFRGGPRRDGGPREGGGEQRGGFRRAPGGSPFGGRGGPDRGPYESPYFTATFYPEDASFSTLVQTIRKSCRTVELFEIARTVVAKDDRFIVVLGHRSPAAAPGAPVPAPEAARPVFHISVPDGLPFDSDEAAVAHVMGVHLDKFFDRADVEVEPPKGSFQVINRCGVTGELLGPPNYHRYNQIVQQHYASRLSGRMGPEAFRGRIETVRDPEVVNQWLAKMRKATRYTWKLSPAVGAAEAPASDAPAAADGAEPASVPTALFFDTPEDARLHLLTHAREKVVRTAENARFPGRLLETLPPGEIRRAVEGALERQRRFPLDTANGLRGRLRREHFTIFKKGSKGVSYVCAVKRKFRVPGQTFSDSIGALIAFIEANPMVRAGELPSKFLGLKLAEKPAEVPPAPAPAEGAASPDASGNPAPAKSDEMSVDDRARLARLQGDLVWLVREGYVTEFIDGRLFAPPVMVEARKKEIEAEEHDPENFPEAPASAESPAAAEPAPSEAVAEPAPIVEQAPETPQAGEPAAQG